eukprot:CCRYP_006478-RH/>CCRYP_006478-RH protein AED:0.45 eAED:0.45 QI:0/-1/0/1/-1/0/1/0/138
MVLAAHSDASYLSEPQARSRAGGHFFLSSNADIPPNNGRSSTLPTSLNMSWRPPLKPNWPLCSLPPVKLSTYASYSWNLATSNPPHHSKPTMPWRSSHQWESTTQAHQGHGHALPLVTRSRMPKTISNLLAPWPQQLC